MPANSSILRVLIVLLLIVVILPFSQASGVGTPLPDLFGPPSKIASKSPPGPAEQRARSTSLNLAEVERIRADLEAGRVPGALGLSLFDDAYLAARFERVERHQTGGYTLGGRIDGSPFGEIHLSVVGGALYASLNTPQGLFRVSSPDGRTAEITQVDPRLLPPEEERVPVPAPVPAQALEPAAVTAGLSTTDDGSRIDVYVGYTAAARAAAGGAAAIQAVILTAIAETNTGYANSGINQRVALVGYGEYAYSEVGFDWDITLDRWTDPGDGVFGPAHTLRDTLEADEMVLLVDAGGYCGLGWLMTSGVVSTAFAPHGFSLVDWTCATGYYSFAHEMGHNMGAHHDRYSAAGGQGAFNYSYGFWILNPATSRYDWRTVMAYNVPASYGYNSFRINYWSNPSVTYNGQPTGVAAPSPQSANNALTLNNTAPYVAMFRDGASPAAPTNLTVTPLSATANRLNWVDASNDEWRFRIERTLSTPISWVEIGIAAANATTYTDNTASSGTTYQYRVLSDNGNGRSESNIGTSPSPIPASPSGLVITSSSLTSAALSWTDNSSNETLFRVKRAPAAVDTWTDLGTVAANLTNFTDNAVPTGSGYRYQVFAENLNNASGSNIAILPAIPAAPTGLTAAGVSQTALKLNWTDNATSEDGYKVERAPYGGAFVPLATVAGVNGVTYTDAGIPSGGEYQYRVFAYNARGSSAFSGVVNGLPAKPADMNHTVVNNSRIDLSWTDSSLIESGYIIDRSLDGGATYLPLASVAENTHAYSDTAAACGENIYRMYAFNAVGASPYAMTSGVTAPCKPVLTAAPGSTSVRLSWEAVSGAVSYQVERWDAGSGSFKPIPPVITPPDPTLYVVTGLMKSTAYRYRVVAVGVDPDVKTPSDPLDVATMGFDLFLPLTIR